MSRVLLKTIFYILTGFLANFKVIVDNSTFCRLKGYQADVKDIDQHKNLHVLHVVKLMSRMLITTKIYMFYRLSS